MSHLSSNMHNVDSNYQMQNATSHVACNRLPSYMHQNSAAYMTNSYQPSNSTLHNLQSASLPYANPQHLNYHNSMPVNVVQFDNNGAPQHLVTSDQHLLNANTFNHSLPRPIQHPPQGYINNQYQNQGGNQNSQANQNFQPFQNLRYNQNYQSYQNQQNNNRYNNIRRYDSNNNY